MKPGANCYETEPYPARGWLVTCIVLGRFVIVDHYDNLAHVIGSLQAEADKKYPDRHNPVQCFELGRELQIGIDYAVVRIQPMRIPT